MLHDRKRIHERLTTVADPVGFLVNLFTHAPVGFAVWSADGRALLTNKAFMDIFLVEPPPEYNVLEDELLAANGMLPLFQRAFRGETVQVPTFWYDPREHTTINVTEGRRVAISMTIFPLLDAGGAIEYVAATYKDQTEIMLANERARLDEERLLLASQAELLRREKDAAQAANRELEAFSYSVAHDLRAPLRTIAGFSAALLEDHGPELQGDAKLQFHRIISATERMGQLIDALLSLARLSRAALAHEPVDLAELARSVIGRLRTTDPTRVVDVTMPDRMVVTGDPLLLHTALENLIGNAWKFTRTRSQARIELGLIERPEGTCYFVRDNGVGFDMAHAQRLFGAFQRLHSRDQFEGNGVGLASVQRIIHRHGGRIWAESTEDVGATFYFTLPSAPPG